MFVQILIYILTAFTNSLTSSTLGGGAVKGDVVVRAPMLPGFEIFGLKNVMERGIIKFSLLL